MPIKSKSTDAEKFWSRVNKNGPNGCWEWTRSTVRGYGQLRVSNKYFRAHRYSWFIHNGEIPLGLCVCHHCDNPKCVNPSHLFLGTVKDNADDCVKKGRNKPPRGDSHYFRRQPEKVPIGEMHHAGKLKESDIYKIFEMKHAGFLNTESAKFFNVSKQLIGHILSRKIWKHVTEKI
jgi:hypothetical protein